MSSAPTLGDGRRVEYGNLAASTRKSRRLDFLKCYDCRRDKQKCIPAGRQWPGEKCIRCLEKNLPCSAPHRKERRMKKAEEQTFASSESIEVNEVQQLQDIGSANTECEFPPSTQHQESHGVDGDCDEVNELLLMTYLHRMLSLALNDLCSLDRGEAEEDEACEADINFQDFVIELEEAIFIKASKLVSTRNERRGLQLLLLDLMGSFYPQRSAHGLPEHEGVHERGIRFVERLLASGQHGKAFTLQMELIVHRKQQEVSLQGDWQNLGRCWKQYWKRIQQLLDSHKWQSIVPKYIRRWPFCMPSILLPDQTALQELYSFGVHGDCLGRTLFHILLDSDIDPSKHPDLFMETLSLSVDGFIDFQDMLGRTPLHLACGKGYSHIVGVLLKEGADIKAATVTGLQPMHFALKSGHASILCVLLFHAIREGLLDVIPFLVEHVHVSVNAIRIDGCTALGVAAYLGHSDMVQWLLANGADPNIARHGSKSRALHLAASFSRVACLRILLDRKDINANAKDAWGQTPLMHVVNEGNREAVLTLLSNRHVDIFAKDHRDRTAVDIAGEMEHQDIVSLIREEMSRRCSGGVS